MVGYDYKSELVIYGEGKKIGNLTMDSYMEDIFKPYIIPAYEASVERGEPFILEEERE